MALSDLDDLRLPGPPNRGLRVAIVSTYPPRACGIGTFSSDLRSALLAAPTVERVDLVTVVDQDSETIQPEVIATIREEVPSDYTRAGRLLGRRDIDVVIIEHEYGIFGGREGELLLALTRELTVPYVVTLHTVLSEPSPTQAEVIRKLTRRAALVTVFTATARRLVSAQRLTDQAKVRVVPHGAPEVLTRLAGSEHSTTRAMLPTAEKWGGRPAGGQAKRFVLSSFGLISAGKGLEVAIEALPSVVERHPEALLVIAGQTHPEVAKREGERYRLRLQQLVRSLGMDSHVCFQDRFLSVDELAELLDGTDVYLTPYRSREQIVSGALTFAVAAGRPVVSTPYLYATDLLASGAGVLVPFDDPAAMAEAINGLIDDPDRLAAVRHEARRVGSGLAWPAIGQVTASLLREAVDAGPGAGSPVGADNDFPPLRFDHLLALADDVGIIQHANGAIANRSTGYCVDDVARLAQVAHKLAGRGEDPRWPALMGRALAFLQHSAEATPRGSGLHNFMGYDRRWIDRPHFGDHVGRAVWALGDILAVPPAAAIAEPATALLHQLLSCFEDQDLYPRTAAYALLGLGRLDVDGFGEPARTLLERCVDLLLTVYRKSATDQWPWFEDRLTYDNARLPQALIVSARHLEEPTALEVGLRSLRWYGQECGLDRGYARLPGHHGRDRHQPALEPGDEQPLDAAALVEAELDALAVTGSDEHADRALQAFGWFLGANHLGLPLYDRATGGCRDGLSTTRASLNEGAESTLACLHAQLRLEAAGLTARAGGRQQSLAKTPA